MKISKKLAAVGILAAVGLSLSGCQNMVQNAAVTCKVVDKDRSTESTKSGSKSVFRIYMEGEGCDDTYGLADNWLAGNFNASDMYAKIKVDKSYRIETVGVRNGFFSSFKEITKMSEAK